jgi:hypothetical protein
MGDAGERIHDQQHALALGAEMFGHGGGEHRAANAQIGRMIGRHGDDGGAGAFGPDHMALDEIGDFAGAFADQADDDDLGIGAMGDHVEQHRFADARTGHDADALAHAKGGDGVERAHARIEGQAHRRPVERAGADTACRVEIAGMDRPEAVDGAAFAIHRAAKKASPTGSMPGRPSGRTRAPGRSITVSPSSMASVRPLRKPITSASSDFPLLWDTRHSEPTGTDRPDISSRPPSQASTVP